MAYVLIVDAKHMTASQSGIRVVILRLFVIHAKTSLVTNHVKELK